MTLYEELKARGLVAQITDEEIIDSSTTARRPFTSASIALPTA